jgi:hypothetical protein
MKTHSSGANYREVSNSVSWATFTDNQLMVVGGWTTGDEECASVEFGTVI